MKGSRQAARGGAWREIKPRGSVLTPIHLTIARRLAPGYAVNVEVIMMSIESVQNLAIMVAIVSFAAGYVLSHAIGEWMKR